MTGRVASPRLPLPVSHPEPDHLHSVTLGLRPIQGPPPMPRLFEQLDSQPTDIGDITLRRRRIPGLTDKDIYEVKLGDEFLMSSLFVTAEEALADLGLSALDGDALNVVVGGLGLGHTAAAALKDDRVGRLWVVEFLAPVIGWHRQGLVPLGPVLTDDPRCDYVLGSFFDLALGEPTGLVPDQPGLELDAILLDIDHSPTAVLTGSNAGFYSTEGLSAMARQLKADGVFAMWSNDPPSDEFMVLLRRVFAQVEAHVVSFYNPFQNNEASSTVYCAKGVLGNR